MLKYIHMCIKIKVCVKNTITCNGSLNSIYDKNDLRMVRLQKLYWFIAQIKEGWII